MAARVHYLLVKLNFFFSSGGIGWWLHISPEEASTFSLEEPERPRWQPDQARPDQTSPDLQLLRAPSSPGSKGVSMFLSLLSRAGTSGRDVAGALMDSYSKQGNENGKWCVENTEWSRNTSWECGCCTVLSSTRVLVWGRPSRVRVQTPPPGAGGLQTLSDQDQSRDAAGTQQTHNVSLIH